jgi:hypothetical protein
MGKPLFFDGTCYDYWKRKISTDLKSMNRKVWEVGEKDFAMINPNNPTPREEEKL